MSLIVIVLMYLHRLCTFMISGAPTRPEIVSPSVGQHKYNYHLKWRVQSHYPIRQHRIKYWIEETDPRGRKPMVLNRSLYFHMYLKSCLCAKSKEYKAKLSPQ